MKTKIEKLKDQLRRAEQMKSVRLQRGYCTEAIEKEIADCKTQLDKLGKAVYSQLSKDAADAAAIRNGECLENHQERVYDLYKKNCLSESEAMNQDF